MEKNSKHITNTKAKGKLWANYCKDNKGFKTFEDYCKPVVNILKHVRSLKAE